MVPPHGDTNAGGAPLLLPHPSSQNEMTLDDGGDESRLEVDEALARGRQTEYEILDEIRESSIGDDEEPGDWTGYGFLRFVRLSVLGGARGAAQLITSASGHQPDNVEEEVARSGAPAGTAAEAEEESLVSVFVLVLGLIQWRQLLRRTVARHFVRKLHPHLVVL